MKILLLDRLEADVLDNMLADHVVYRPDLLRKGTDILHRVVMENKIDAIITSSNLPTLWLEQWAQSRSSPLYLVQVEIGDHPQPTRIALPEKMSEQQEARRFCLLRAYGENEATAYINAFAILEYTFTSCELKQFTPIPPACSAANNGKRVLIVGTGIVNLITAYVLQQAAYAVELVDARPDPRDNASWRAYGCSRGGGDARMFTLSEMDNYHDKELSQEMNSLFRRDITELGWNIYENALSSQSEQRWVKTFEDIPVWLAQRYNEDIFAFNHESYSLWEDWLEREPALFAQSVLRKGILRLYSDKTHYANAVQRQKCIGAIERLLTPSSVAEEQPALADAVADGYIAGGICVVGFTINVHKFMKCLLDRLEQRGATFAWKQPIKSIAFDAQNHVIGVSGTDSVWEADHYVISPGAFGNQLLTGTRSQGKIHGVLGGWLELPNIEPQLLNSLKLARKGHITEDANITVAIDGTGQLILIIGSGYGHTGLNPENIDEVLLRQMYHGIIDTASKYFPNAYQVALDTGGIERSLRYCVRPWTATGLGLFETLATRQGGACIITGGHNTGGFTQSPIVAQAILATLSGRQHLMHSLYHPERGYAFINSALC